MSKKEKKQLSGVAQEFQDNFGTHNLYEILGLDPDTKDTITDKDVKKAYYKCSLKYHPDRAAKSEAGASNSITVKFQLLGKAYSILSDTEKRNVYDETGIIDEHDFIDDDDKDWGQYWRLLFPKVTLKDIQKFEAKYKGSDDELNDLKEAYLKYEGNMADILENVLCSTHEDEERFEKILNELIENEELEEFPAFRNESKASKAKRRKKAKKEEAEAEEAYKEMFGKERALQADDNELENMILARQQDRSKNMDSFFDQLEAKYAKKGGKKKK